MGMKPMLLNICLAAFFALSLTGCEIGIASESANHLGVEGRKIADKIAQTFDKNADVVKEAVDKAAAELHGVTDKFTQRYDRLESTITQLPSNAVKLVKALNGLRVMWYLAQVYPTAHVEYVWEIYSREYELNYGCPSFENTFNMKTTLLGGGIWAGLKVWKEYAPKTYESANLLLELDRVAYWSGAGALYVLPDALGETRQFLDWRKSCKAYQDELKSYEQDGAKFFAMAGDVKGALKEACKIGRADVAQFCAKLGL